MCLIISCLIIGVESPQIFVMYLLFQSGLIVFFVGLKGGVWYAYILFLVFLGGILILFVYARSLASAVKLDYSLKKYVIVLIRGLIILLRVKFCVVNTPLIRSENSNIEGSIVKELISDLRRSFYLYIVCYLLLTLYNVCWIIKFFEGPLKKFSL